MTQVKFINLFILGIFLLWLTPAISQNQNNISTTSLDPKGTELSNVLVSDLQALKFELLDKQALFTFAGGILFMTQDSFKKSGAWDERFEGW